MSRYYSNYEEECDNFDGDHYREHMEHVFNARFDDVRERYAGEINLDCESDLGEYGPPDEFMPLGMDPANPL